MNAPANALLKFNSRRATRMTEAEARETLTRLGFTRYGLERRSGSRDGRSETVYYSFERAGSREDGSPRYDRARLTVTFSV